MKIASVIVDVASSKMNRPFDYEVPLKWQESVEVGMRVVVPFGPRKLQGFVVALKNESELEKLRPIEQLVDIERVLNDELLQLGFWLCEETLAFYITAFQVMLPAAVKASYDKFIICHQYDALPEEVKALFVEGNRVNWKEAEAVTTFSTLQKLVKERILTVHYEVKSKGRAKKQKVYAPLYSSEQLTRYKESEKLTTPQQRVVQFFIDMNEEILATTLLQQLEVTTSPIKTLIKKGIVEEKMVELYRDPYENRTFQKTTPLQLTEQQQRALHGILRSLDEKRHETFLLYGVTGSGKTEVYLQAIQEVIAQGKEAIVLVPEISLTPQMVQRFKSRFGSLVAVLHSGLSVGEKYDEWRKVQRKEVKVVVGARSAVFAPFENLGIIIIDEEHESSYKQEENPRYHARDVALWRGNYHQCPVVLGSATPTLETFARAQKDVYTLLSMPNRMSKQGLPSVHIVDMREELRNSNRSMFSTVLHEKIEERLQKGEQIVLFLNRRGYSSFVMCRDCGEVLQCPHCDISLTYHRTANQLKCHYCEYVQPMLTNCPKCESERIRLFGTGTQKVEEEITKLFPLARVIRMDVDTTSKKGAHEKLLTSFEKGEANILL
ncbi:MAG: replication restart helicase PriA, partial [Bacilli bacterium]